jgi:hypothetical protein
MDLALISISTRNVRELHVVGKSMHNSALPWRKSGWKNECFTGVVILEEKELRVELQSLGIVKI